MVEKRTYSARPMSSKRIKPPRHANALRKKRKRSFGRFILKAFLTLFILLLLAAGGAWLVYSIATPHYRNWAQEYDLEYINELERPSIIFDRKGREIGRIFVENRSYIPLSKISPQMVNALIAQEDSRFRIHNGFDPLGIGRAVLELARSRSVNQGASTITQQLARNAFDLKKRAMERNESGYSRKIVEIFLALRIEERYSKDQILEFYLNRVYFGSGYYGIRSASLGYFGKEPIDLTTREAASIAGLIKNPNGLSPLNNPKENLKWRNHVLSRMTLEGYLTGEEAERLKKMDLGLNPKPLQRNTSHIYKMIEGQINEYLSEERTTSGGLRIYTTLDKDIHDKAMESLSKKLEEIEKRPGYNHPLCRDFKPDGVTIPRYIDGAALVVDNTNGAILAYVGGRDFGKRHFDSIENGMRPTGSAFLPIVYSAAFENRKSPATMLMDDALDNRMAGIGGSEGILGEWGAESNKNRYEGNITARRALSASKIAATLRLGQEVGSDALVQTMKNLKLSLPVPESVSKEGVPTYRNRIYAGTEPLSLKEMTRAFMAFSSNGKIPETLYFLDRIEDETGYTIWQSPQSQSTPEKRQAVSPATAYQINSILKDSLQNGSASQLKSKLDENFNGFVKTGTNYDFSDNWCFAGNTAITGGVWVGFSEGRKSIYPGAFSVDTAGPILADIVNTSLKSHPAPPLTMPGDVEALEICKVSGKRASKFCYEVDPSSSRKDPLYRRCTYTEFFRKGDISMPVCTVHGEEGMTLDSFISTIGPDNSTRVLPVPPIIPQSPVLVGEDPYHSEKIVIETSRSYDFSLNMDAPSETSAVIVEDEDESHNDDARLSIPPPPPVKLKLPEQIPGL